MTSSTIVMIYWSLWLVMISCHLHFLTSEHCGCSVETLRLRMTGILNISHQSLISVDSRHESRLSLHFWKEKVIFFSCCQHNLVQRQTSIWSLWTALSVFSHKWEAVTSRRIWTILPRWQNFPRNTVSPSDNCEITGARMFSVYTKTALKWSLSAVIFGHLGTNTWKTTNISPSSFSNVSMTECNLW